MTTKNPTKAELTAQLDAIQNHLRDQYDSDPENTNYHTSLAAFSEVTGREALPAKNMDIEFTMTLRLECSGSAVSNNPGYDIDAANEYIASLSLVELFKLFNKKNLEYYEVTDARAR